MSEPQGPESDADLLRARRVEVVDGDGNVRVVLGAVEAPDGSPSFGLALLDADGRPRAWLALPPSGPELAFNLGGNVVVHVGVTDAGPEAVDVGPYIQLSDRDGRPVVGWQIDEEGTVTVPSEEEPE